MNSIKNYASWSSLFQKKTFDRIPSSSWLKSCSSNHDINSTSHSGYYHWPHIKSVSSLTNERGDGYSNDKMYSFENSYGNSYNGVYYSPFCMNMSPNLNGEESFTRISFQNYSNETSKSQDKHKTGKKLRRKKKKHSKSKFNNNEGNTKMITQQELIIEQLFWKNNSRDGFCFHDANSKENSGENLLEIYLAKMKSLNPVTDDIYLGPGGKRFSRDWKAGCRGWIKDNNADNFKSILTLNKASWYRKSPSADKIFSERFDEREF